MLTRLVTVGSLLLFVGAASCSGSGEGAPPGGDIPNGRDAGADADAGRASNAGGKDGGHASADAAPADAAPAPKCNADADCTASAPATTPVGCAVGKCD